MNVNADALSRSPIVNEEKSRNLHEDDDYDISKNNKS